MIYKEENISVLQKKLAFELKLAERIDKANFHKDIYSNVHRKRYKETKKLISLLENNVTVETYLPGTVIVNDKIVVSLVSNKWRNKNKNKWYFHTDDIKKFIDKYIGG